MATVHPPVITNRGDGFELELSRVRERVKVKFVELIDCLKVRESKLLRELDNILASYLTYRSELEKVNEKKAALERTKSMIEDELSTSPIRSVHEDFIFKLNKEIESIEYPVKTKIVSFECDSNKMLAELNNLGKLVEKVSGIDYKSKKKPLVSVCERGNGMKQLDWPRGVTIDNKTGNIFISDQSNNCMKVFDSTGKFMLKLGDNEGEGRMFFPRGLAIFGDRVLVSQGNHCILNYQLNGKFISRIGIQGNGKVEFTKPYDLTFDESNGDVYICDSGNNRIQILSSKFSFKSEFGKATLNSPRDVKLSKEYIFVLDQSNPCLHLFDYNNILHSSSITRGIGMQVTNPIYFFLDNLGNILISDPGSNFIHIFNTECQLFHKIPVTSKPTGVAVDNQGRVIVVCQADKDCLQIF